LNDFTQTQPVDFIQLGTYEPIVRVIDGKNANKLIYPTIIPCANASLANTVTSYRQVTYDGNVITFPDFSGDATVSQLQILPTIPNLFSWEQGIPRSQIPNSPGMSDSTPAENPNSPFKIISETCNFIQSGGRWELNNIYLQYNNTCYKDRTFWSDTVKDYVISLKETNINYANNSSSIATSSSIKYDDLSHNNIAWIPQNLIISSSYLFNVSSYTSSGGLTFKGNALYSYNVNTKEVKLAIQWFSLQNADSNGKTQTFSLNLVNYAHIIQSDIFGTTSNVTISAAGCATICQGFTDTSGGRYGYCQVTQFSTGGLNCSCTSIHYVVNVPAFTTEFSFVSDLSAGISDGFLHKSNLERPNNNTIYPPVYVDTNVQHPSIDDWQLENGIIPGSMTIDGIVYPPEELLSLT
jgi:hypothetical protein